MGISILGSHENNFFKVITDNIIEAGCKFNDKKSELFPTIEHFKDAVKAAGFHVEYAWKEQIVVPIFSVADIESYIDGDPDLLSLMYSLNEDARGEVMTNIEMWVKKKRQMGQPFSIELFCLVAIKPAPTQNVDDGKENEEERENE